MQVIEGDLRDITSGYIMQCVNCQNKIGRDLARSLYEKWPVVKESYHDFCQDREPIQVLGHYQIVNISSGLHVINVFGQLNYGADGKCYADYGAIKLALQNFSEFLGLCGIRPDDEKIYFPWLFGAGLAGGDPKLIHKIIEFYLPNSILVKLSS